MTIHLEFSPATVEVACHSVAALFYMATAMILADDKDHGGFAIFIPLFLGIIFNSIGAHQ